MSYDCYCDYDAPEWHNSHIVKAARKPHKCYECRAPILVGESYEYTAGKWDGDVNFFHICTRCVELREWARISVPCFCWAYGNLHDDVREMVSEVRRDVPGFVFEWGRRMVKIKRERKRRTSEHPSHQENTP
jgi:hypothetical protein